MMTQNKMIDLTDLGLLSIAGEQAKKFLQGQLTCKLDEITETQSRLGAHCNPQGRVISLFRIFIHNDNYFLQMPRELIPLAKNALQKYAVFFKVTLRDVTHDFQQLGYVGKPLTNISTDKVVNIHLPGIFERYLFIGEANSIMTLKNQLAEQAVESDFNYWKSMDIADNFAAIYPDTSEKFLPHDLDLPALDAVSFDKGCYTGQEIIARMQYRGKLKNHLYKATVKTELSVSRGADIYIENKSCGNIVDFCQIDYNNYELLVIAQDRDIESHTLFLDPENNFSLKFLKG